MVQIPQTASAPRLRIAWHRRLETRVAIGIGLVIGASLSAMLLATVPLVRTNALSRASDDFEATRAAFDHLVDGRAAFASAQLRLVTELPVFRAHMTDPRLVADATTMDTMVDEYRRKVGAQFSVVTGSKGQWVASPGFPASAPQEALSPAIMTALGGSSFRVITDLEGRLYLVVTEPMRFVDEVLATATAGYLLDHAVARELALTTRGEVTLLSGRRVSGSSLPPVQWDALLDLVAVDEPAAGAQQDAPELRTIGTSQYIGGVYPLAAGPNPIGAGQLVLLQDWRPTQLFIDRVRSGAVGIGVLMFLLALGGGVAMSRRITRPLRDMADVAGDVAAGHWDRSVPVRGADETAALATAFNNMTAALSHWHGEARSRAAELQDAYDRFYAVTQSAYDAIVSTDQQGQILFWNRAAARIFGYTDREVLGRPVEDLLEPEARARYRAHVDHLRQMPDDNMPDSVIEATALHKESGAFPIELSLATWTSGDQINVTAIVRDLTDRKRTEEALRKSEAELRHAHKMDAIGRLAGGVAHDFNNLLTAIRGYAELLFVDLDESDPRRADASEILKAADSAGSLTRQLLAFSRKQILAPRVVQLDDIVRGMEKMLRRLIGEDVELVVEVAPDIWPVKADPGQIEQVVLNLAVNARDAMPTGGRLTIAVASSTVAPGAAPKGRHGEFVEMTVTDSGTGMDPATLPHIFEPFFTTKAEGRGTGLGLATVDGIVEQSGGVIDVKSEPGRGTTFRILLPRVRDAVAAADTATPGLHSGTETVLLVEDEPAVRHFARQVLTRAGYHVLEAAHGEDALSRASAHQGPIHLLLTDVVMPRMSGRVLWERLSTFRGETKVLFVSGYTDDAVVRHGIRESGLPYLQKPFSLTSLTAAVRRALGESVRSS